MYTGLCSVERCEVAQGITENSRGGARRASQETTTSGLLPSGEKCLFHKAGLVRSREEVKGPFAGPPHQAEFKAKLCMFCETDALTSPLWVW